MGGGWGGGGGGSPHYTLGRVDVLQAVLPAAIGPGGHMRPSFCKHYGVRRLLTGRGGGAG